MKKCYPCGALLAGLACALLTVSAYAVSPDVARERGHGHLTINRFPALGGAITAFVSIDGAAAGRIRWGQSYHNSLAPGDHFISVMVYPNHMIPAPAEKHFNVQSGQSYVFTLKWDGDCLVLM